jgi:GGDEF domain-containing protein
VARIGGDEFAVLAVEYEAGTDVLESRLVELLSDAGINASVGVAACPPEMTVTEAFERADAAMYERKRTRRAARLS